MEEWTCKRCGYETEYKFNLVAHLKKIKPCQAKIADYDIAILMEELTLNNKEKNIKCNYCDECFSSDSTKFRHQRICTTKKNIDYVKTLEDRIKLLESNNPNTNPSTSTSTIINTNTNTNNTNTINSNNTVNNNSNINFYVMPFGSENTKYITPDFLTKCLKRTNEGVIDLIKHIHFNEDYKENQNIKVSNKKLNYIETHNGKRWQYNDKEKIINQLMDEGFRILDDHYYENEADLKKNLSRSILNNIDKFMTKADKKDSNIIKPLFKEIYLVILNNSYMLVTNK